ncbi:hypothetical protein TCON_0053 [Astathelohania contejeani]|uniref:Uncharacterized protein n=1 Tax=Astathelohania contejeani TaxID=164912 RepID=A0ABQ7I2N2_9MICR|nr:hypothetical protein TCON_0053 [Thelohania contejeani]
MEGNKIIQEFALKLTNTQRAIINQLKIDYEALINDIDPVILDSPYLSFQNGLNIKFAGKKIIRKDKYPLETKRPSVILQVGDQSYLFDGEKFMYESPTDNKMKSLLSKVEDAIKKAY